MGAEQPLFFLFIFLNLDVYKQFDKSDDSVVSVLHDQPSSLCCPDVLNLVGDTLSGNGCGLPNHI